MKILRLTLTKKWFDMIYSGEKLEEYREIKSYWIKRLIANSKELDDNGILNYKAVFKEFDAIEFVNGYSPISQRFTIECKGIDMGQGNSNWGADVSQMYFIIKLGKILIHPIAS